VDHRKGASRREFIQGAGLVAGGLVSSAIVPTEGQAGSAPQAGPDTPGARFARLIERGEPLMAPGAFDIMSARLIEVLGFEAAVVGGSAVSANAYGIPDHGLVTVTELIEFSSRIAQSIDIPVMADADDAGGSPISVYRAIQGFERGGIASVMIEDHIQAKHLGGGGRLVTTGEMVEKIRAAVDARRDPNFYIIARGDAMSIGLSKDEALDRGRAYAEAGADMLFFAGMPQDELPEAAEATGKPLMTTVNSTPIAELRQNRVGLAVYASHAVNVAMGAAHDALKELKETGQVTDMRERSLPGAIRSQLTRTAESIERGRRYGLVEK
jgi:2-methylisocitrate lyase-like PEP mutase family enzyme